MLCNKIEITAIFGILNGIFFKNRRSQGVLEEIRALYANRDEYSYIRVAFRKQHSEKQPE